MKNLQESRDGFPDTRWTLIQIIKQQDHPLYQTAAQSLATNYWPPVYSYLRRVGQTEEAACDLAQAFFQEVVISRKLFEVADRSRGQLRALLLTALKRYLIDDRRRKQADPTNRFIPLPSLTREESILWADPMDDPDRAFERRWALSVLQEALRRCEEQHRNGQYQSHWKAFEASMVLPSFSGGAPPTRDQIATELGFNSAAEVTSAVRLIRKRLLTLLRQVAGETADNGLDQEAEYQQVVSMLR